MDLSLGRWEIFYKGKVITIGDTVIDMIRRDPMDIMGWFDWELMKAW